MSELIFEKCEMEVEKQKTEGEKGLFSGLIQIAFQKTDSQPY